LPVVCPEFDAELSPIEHIRSNVMPWLEANWQVKPPALAAFGVSMGGQGVLQLAYRHPNEFPVVAALAPLIDFQEWMGYGLPLDDMFADVEAARQQTATLQLQGLNWPRHQFLACDPADHDALPGVEKLASKLHSSGVPFESDFATSHGGHSWEYFDHLAPRVMQFLVNGLEAEFRRVV
jgi:S-formylglutathione hydrolase FrmB